MTFKYLLSRVATIFSIILLTTTPLASHSIPRGFAMLMLFFEYLVISAMIILGMYSFLSYWIVGYYKKNDRLWSTTTFVVILVFSYLFSFLIIWKCYPPGYIHHLPEVKRSLETSLLLVYGLATILQTFAWILLFRKDGWKLVLFLTIMSTLYPIICLLLSTLFYYLKAGNLRIFYLR